MADCENHRVSEYSETNGAGRQISWSEVTVAGYQTVAQRNLTCAIRIRERRRQLGLTQAEVVNRVNGHGSRLSNQALSAIENGRRLAVGRLPDLSAALECTVSYLLGLTSDPDRWEPDDLRRRGGRTAPADRTASADRTAPADRIRPPADRIRPPADRIRPPADRTGPGVAGPPRRSWILGPDLPGGPVTLIPLILPRRRDEVSPGPRRGAADSLLAAAGALGLAQPTGVTLRNARDGHGA
jgi:transcriptional regulator with XRE-family HTH domain